MALSGCASPGHEFFGIAPQPVVLGGRTYQVYVDRAENRVQVIRMGYARRAEHPAILESMIVAAQTVSGCAVDSRRLQGDSGVMNARLVCPP